MSEIVAGINKHVKSKYLYYTSYYFITAVLLVSGITKIINPQPLLDTLNLIKFLPEEIRIVMATALLLFELTLAILLVGKIKVKLTLLLTSGLFFLFLAFSVYGSVAGFNTDCGCFGDSLKSSFGISMIIRNLFFMAIVVFLFVSKSIEKMNG